MSSSAQELEREVEASRAGVEHTIEALRDRLSVGQMVDEGMKYFRESGGGEITRRLSDQVRSNPLPLMLVGVGLAWLMSGRGQPHLSDSDQGYRDRSGHDDGYPHNTFAERDPAAAYRSGDGFEGSSDRSFSGEDEASSGDGSEGPGLAERASAAAGWAGDRVGSLGHAGKDAFMRARQSSSGAFRGASDQAGDAYRGASHYAGDAYSGLQRSVSEMLEREPLIIGAIGLAVGAAIGAALPRTEIEDRLMGEGAEQVKDQAKHLAEEQLDRAKDAAQKAYEAARDEAGSQLAT